MSGSSAIDRDAACELCGAPAAFVTGGGAEALVYACDPCRSEFTLDGSAPVPAEAWTALRAAPAPDRVCDMCGAYVRADRAGPAIRGFVRCATCPPFSSSALETEARREVCGCGELRDDFGACWKCDAPRDVDAAAPVALCPRCTDDAACADHEVRP